MLRVLELAIFAGIVIVVISLLAWRFYFGPLSARQKSTGTQEKVTWNATLSTIADIRSEWVEYETTDNFLLDLPSLTNREIPEVDAYHKMMLRLSTDYPAIEEMRKSEPSHETLEFLKQIIDAHSKAKSRAKQLDR
jgi:hypothetical protein